MKKHKKTPRHSLPVLLAERVPPPQKVAFKTSFVFRYVEQLPKQALVQKLARVVTTLQAATVLMQHGFVQEQGALQRVIHEIHEDITFLAYGVMFDDLLAAIGAIAILLLLRSLLWEAA